MKRAILTLSLLFALASEAANTTYVNVGTTATKMPATRILQRSSLLVENNGANDLWCAYLPVGAIDGDTPTIAIGKGHKVAAGTARAFPGDTLWCACSVAQTGTGTDTTAVSEVSGGAP